MTTGSPRRLIGTRVLVVDDDADNRELLAMILEHEGAVVSTAGSADEALVVMEREQPHLLISDIGLPDEDGFSLLRKVRALPSDRGGDCHAIALTGYGAGEFHARSGAEGFQAHLTKPIDAEEVLAVIARVIEGLPGRKVR